MMNGHALTALLVLWIATFSLRPAFAAELEVDELISAIRTQISAAEEQARKDPMFKVKEIELTISYALHKEGAVGFKAYVITAGTSLKSEAVQTMKVSLTPIKTLMVKAPWVLTGKVRAVDVKSGSLELDRATVNVSFEGSRWVDAKQVSAPEKLDFYTVSVKPETKIWGVRSLGDIAPGKEIWVSKDAMGETTAVVVSPTKAVPHRSAPPEKEKK